MREQLGFIYDEFKDRVTRGRGVGRSDLESIAGGRVWTGAEALGLGLTDEVGGFDEALGKACELGKVDRKGPQVLHKISPPRSGRPAPGKPAEAAREMFDEIMTALIDLRGGRVWAVSPYDLHEG
jgi:protease-4